MPNNNPIFKTDPLSALKNLFREIGEDYTFFGIGIHAFNRLGPQGFISRYQILCLEKSLEDSLIKKDVAVFCLKDYAKNYCSQAPKNSNTILKHAKTQQYIKKNTFKKQAVIIPYKPYVAMRKKARQNGWIIAANPCRFGKKLFENKILFRQLLIRENLPVTPGEIINAPQEIITKFPRLKERYGLPLVVQHPSKGGGKGTFFIKSIEDAQKVLPLLEGQTLILKFIKGPSPSITGCVTPWGIAYTRPQYQILDQAVCHNLKANQGNGLWCGHDWTFSRDHLSPIALNNMYEATVRVGECLKSQNYKGIFGLDFIQDEDTGKVYISECNPRLLGSFPVMTMVQQQNSEVPILALHILAFLTLSPKHNNIMRHLFNATDAQMQKAKSGAQLVIHNQENCWAQSHNIIKPGVYKIKNRHLSYMRKGYSLSHLKKTGEFLLSDGLLYRGSLVAPNHRIMRLITSSQLLEDYNKLNDWAIEAVQASYQALKLKPAHKK